MRWVEDAAETAEDSAATVASGGDSGAGFLAEERVTHTHTHGEEREGKERRDRKDQCQALKASRQAALLQLLVEIS